MLRPKVLLTLLWFAFVVRGFWYCAVQPAWEGYDEAYHFAALQHVASGQGLAHTDTPVSLEVQKSLHLLPLPWELQFQSIPRPLLSHEAFWALSPEEREQRINAVRAIDPAEATQPATEPILNYEGQQPPLYYWLLAPLMRWLVSLPLLSRLYLLRFANVLLASVAIPIAYWIARSVLRSDAQALAITGIIVLLTELMINVGRVSNESLALVCYTAVLAGAVMVIPKPLNWSGWLTMGIALGCGLLTKAYVLSAVPAVLAVGLASMWSMSREANKGPERFPVVIRLAAAMVIAVCIAGAWYARVHAATGSWTGVTMDAALGHVSLAGKLAAIPHVNWKSGFASILISHVWFGTWSFVRVPLAIYLVSFVVIAMSAWGVLRGLMRRRGAVAERRTIVVLAAFYVCFWAGLLYEVVINYMVFGVSASAGWYLYATVAAEIVLLVWGLQTFVSARIVFAGLAIGVCVLDLYGMHALLMPYYTGFAAHTGDSVRPVLRVAISNLPAIFDRLAQLRPTWLNTPALVISWIAYWLATVAVAITVLLVCKKTPANA